MKTPRFSIKSIVNAWGHKRLLNKGTLLAATLSVCKHRSIHQHMFSEGDTVMKCKEPRAVKFSSGIRKETNMNYLSLLGQADPQKRMGSRQPLLATGALFFALFGLPQVSHAVTDVFSTFRDGGGNSTISSGSPIATLTVPAGKYAINAKINIDNDEPAFVVATCMLQAGGDFDKNQTRHAPSGVTSVDNMAIPLQVVHTFGAGTSNTITLSCTLDKFAKVSFRFAKITAIRVDGGPICNKPSPAVCL